LKSATAPSITALAGLKGVGAQAVDLIVEARKDGLFTSLAEFAARVNPRAINKRVIESFAAAGAFDALGFQSCPGVRRLGADPGGMPAQP